MQEALQQEYAQAVFSVARMIPPVAVQAAAASTSSAATSSSPKMKPVKAPAGDPKEGKKEGKKGKDSPRGAKKEGGAASEAGGSAKGIIEVQSIKGTRDWPPELMRQRDWLFGMWRQIARRYAFDEYDAPILEEENLYKRKAGEEISEQIYNFVTKDDTKVTLRPEMTPSLARLVLQKGKSMIFPAKWYAICQCWRFEAIQKGRKREHFQWNMDIIGCKFVSAEAEIIAAAIDFLKLAGLTSEDILIKVNSRKILQRVLERQGVSTELFGPVCIAVDKLDKIGPEEVKKELSEKGVQAETVDKIVRILSMESLDEVKKELPADDPYVVELEQFFSYIKAYGCADWVVFSPSVVRGLVYYTGIVFEGFDRKQKSRAIFGGGRYDELLTKLGSPQPIPCVGFGFGDCVIMDVLTERGLVPDLSPAVQDLIIPFNESMRTQGVQVAQILRNQGRQVDICLDARKVKNSFSYADRIGAQRAIFVAPDEWEKGCVRVKDLRSGTGKEGGKDKTETDNGLVIKIADLK